jgi:hypothetical protein
METMDKILPYSPEWFRLRCGMFTGSEAWKLMTEPRSKKDMVSKTAETYILEKVHEKLTGQLKQGIDNYATQWGVEHEPLAKEWYGKISGNTVHDTYLVMHERLENFSCTPDAFVNEDGLTEIKCPANGHNHLKHCFITNDEYFKSEHPEYYWQAIAQMNITKRAWCDFVSFDPRINTDLGFFCYRLNYNESDGELLESKVEQATEMFNGFYELFSKSYVKTQA